MYLLAPFNLQNFKKAPELWGCDIFRPKMVHLSWTNFFLVQTIIITFIYLLALFIVQNLKKFLQWIQSYEDVPFLGPKWSICSKQMFFWKLLVSLSSTYLPLSLCKILKKFFLQIQNYEDAQLLSPKWSMSSNEDFFSRKPVNEPCFFHSYLSTCKKSKSDINLLVKY